MMDCENIGCEGGYTECEECNGTNLNENDEVCTSEDCFDGLVECQECNVNNMRNSKRRYGKIV